MIIIIVAVIYVLLLSFDVRVQLTRGKTSKILLSSHASLRYSIVCFHLLIFRVATIDATKTLKFIATLFHSRLDVGKIATI